MISNRPYRSLILKEYKETVYRVSGLRCASAPTSNIFSDGITASSIYNAIPHPIKGAVIANPINFDDFKRTDNPFLVQAHPGQELLDLSFSPHAGNVLATCGKDDYVRVFELPQDGQITGHISNPTVKIHLPGQFPTTVAWHPTVRGLLAIGCRECIILANVDYDNFGTVEDVSGFETIDGRLIFKALTAPEGVAGKDIVRLSFNYDGSIISAIAKDGGLFVFDPRKVSPAEIIPSQASLLGEMKNPMLAPFIGEKSNYLFVAGLGRARRPSYRLFKIGDLDSNHTGNYTLSNVCHGDLNISSGQLFIHYDYDTQLVLVSARGARAIFVYDTSVLTGDKPMTAAFIPLLQLNIASGTKGFTFLPKTNVNVMEAEVLKFHSHTGESVEIFGVNVIRRDKGYHAELYPSTASTTPSNTFDDYADGKDVQPHVVSLSPYGEKTIDLTTTTTTPSAAAPAAGAATAASQTTTGNVSVITDSPSGMIVTPATAAVTANMTPNEARAKALTGFNTNYRNTLDAKLSRSAFYHTSGVEPGANKDHYNAFDLRPPKKHLPYGRTLVANSEIYALPLESAGGSMIYPRLMTSTGRVSTKPTGIQGPSPITALAVNELHRRTIASASEDGIVRVYRLPETWTQGDLPANITDPHIIYDDGSTHGLNFQILMFHPYVEHVLVGIGYHSGMGCDVICVFDTTPGTENDKRCQLYHNLYDGRACDLDFSPDGTHVVIGTKNNTVIIIALPSGTVRTVFNHGQSLQRDVFVKWLDRTHVVGIGNIRGGDRAITLWSIDWTNLSSKLLKSETFSSTYALIPYLDITTGLLFVAGVGTAQIRIYAINPDAQPFITALSVFQSKNDIVSHVFLHKSIVNVNEVEMVRSLKLTQPNEVFPISWRIPRKRKEFFQDDLYLSGTPIAKTMVTSEFYFTSQLERAVMVDPNQSEYTIPFTTLQPDGMINLSEAPEEELTERQQKYIQMKFETSEEREKPKGFLGHTTKEEVDNYYLEMAKRVPISSGRYEARTNLDLNDVDDDEWD